MSASKLLPFLPLALAGCGSLPASTPAQTQTPPRPSGPQSDPRSPNQLSAREAIARLEAERDPFWLHAKREIDRSSDELIAQVRHLERRGKRLDTIIRTGLPGRTIALTFDDGPHPGFTPRILDALRQANVKASFFLVGSQAEMHPDLVRQIAAEGHTVGNHTYHHVSLPKIPLEYAAEEVKACGEVLGRILGAPPRFFRPPGGQYDSDLAAMVNSLGYVLVLWTDNPGDFEPGKGTVAQRVMSRIRPGGVVLMHDGAEETVAELPALIARLKQNGYRFVTMDEIEAARPRRR